MHILTVEIPDDVAENLKELVRLMQDDNATAIEMSKAVVALESQIPKEHPAGMPLCLGMVIITSNKHQIKIEEYKP
jgi:hypothetical protein